MSARKGKGACGAERPILGRFGCSPWTPLPCGVLSYTAITAAWKGWTVAVGGFGLAVIALLIYLQSRPLPPPKVSGYVAVTHDGNPKGLVGTDGARLYFNEWASAGSAIAQVSGSGGEVAHVPVPSPTMSLLAVSPDGATLLVADEVGQTAFSGSLWGLRCSADHLADWERPLYRPRDRCGVEK